MNQTGHVKKNSKTANEMKSLQNGSREKKKFNGAKNSINLIETGEQCHKTETNKKQEKGLYPIQKWHKHFHFSKLVS